MRKLTNHIAKAIDDNQWLPCRAILPGVWPSLSSSIKEVEQEFGVEIFERTSRCVSLTHRGQKFLSDIHFISSHYDHIFKPITLWQADTGLL